MEKLKTLVLENTWLPRRTNLDFGWGNGYVLLPANHPMHGKDHYAISELVNVHFGLTYSELVDEELLTHFAGLDSADLGKWMVGFDTVHHGDTLAKWPREAVQIETDRLEEQLRNLLAA